MAQFMQLSPAPVRLDDAENIAGLTFRVDGGGGAFNLALGHIPSVSTLRQGGTDERF